ncbi:MAG: protein-S-isoprenylcysteine O-methyltransferase [Thermoguttaceae bacterium]|jgi:protein-S-isoprenylcysteine O-methyltransferase Ste14
MNILYAKSVLFYSFVAIIVIRSPYLWQARQTKVLASRKGVQEKLLLALAGVAFAISLNWIFSPVFSFADYSINTWVFAAGILVLAIGLWLLQRSHSNLGRSWSMTLELRENHALVTSGVYRHLRHPMYSAMLLISIGQALITPNWLVAPVGLVVFVLLFALRFEKEEAMMLEQFGEQYATYVRRTRRLVPGIW